MYQKLLRWCKDSEVILASRLHVLAGVLLVLLDVIPPFVTQENLQMFIANPKIIAAALIANGVSMELLRRHRAEEVADPAGGTTTLLK